MSFATGARLSTKGIDGGVELLHVKFIHPMISKSAAS